MNNYLITIANDFNFTNSPLVFNVGLIFNSIPTALITYDTTIPIQVLIPVTFTDASTPVADSRTWSVSGTGVTSNDYYISDTGSLTPNITFRTQNLTYTVSLIPVKNRIVYTPTTATVTITPLVLGQSLITYPTTPSIQVGVPILFTDASTPRADSRFWSVSGGDYLISDSTSITPDITFYDANVPYTISLTPKRANTVYTPNTFTVSITAIEPQATFTPNINQSGQTPFNINFTDTSPGNPTTGFNWTVTPQGSGTFAFVNGTTATSPNPSITFTGVDIFTVTDNIIGYYPASITVTTTAEPQATFTPNTTTAGQAPLTVVFTDTSIPTPDGFNWAVTGDAVITGGTTATPSILFNTYSTTPYTVIDNPTLGGSPYLPATVQVIATQNPAAYFAYTPTQIQVGTTITFTDLSVPVSGSRTWSVKAPNLQTTDYSISSTTAQVTEIIFNVIKAFTVTIRPLQFNTTYVPSIYSVTITPSVVSWILGDSIQSVLGSTTVLTPNTSPNNNVKVDSGANKITLLDPSEYQIIPINNDMTILNSNTLTTPQQGSYTVQLFDNTIIDNTQLVTFSFYVFDKFFNINKKILYNTITRQLPKLYQPTNLLNNIDNIASAGVIQDLYDYNYKLFWNTLVSLGTGSSYNTDLEFTYLGVNNILNNAFYPAEFIKTMMNLSVYSSVQVSQLAIVFSRLLFQFLGPQTYQDNNVAIPVQIVYNYGTWNINVYNTSDIGNVWILGDPGPTGKSVLGSTTILGGITTDTLLWLLNYIVGTLLPSHIKYQINFYPYSAFVVLFNTDVIFPNDFYNPAVSSSYDAFEFINNNNSFNTKGFKLRSS